jgi:integrase
MAKLMREAKGKDALYLAIAGFAGIRAAEIMRLEWADFNFARGHITVAADKESSKFLRRKLSRPPADQVLMVSNHLTRMSGEGFEEFKTPSFILWARWDIGVYEKST